ncbi:MAG: hypothetical protein CMH98_02820 [Oceanospirillaceae bacterium]|nr:hypothetical protein [Oceanospirillaceae bacterium]|tara:strand:- start:165805 stop:166446 length:642 start_codon:yes stop_codon:yes gene_type:complete
MPENESPQARRKSQKTWLLSALILVWLVATLAGLWWFQQQNIRPFVAPGDDSRFWQASQAAPLLEDLYRNLPDAPERVTLIHFWNPDCLCNQVSQRHFDGLIHGFSKQDLRIIVVAAPTVTEAGLEQFKALNGDRLEVMRAPAGFSVPASPGLALFSADGKLGYFGAYGFGALCTVANDDFFPNIVRSLAGEGYGPFVNVAGSGCFCPWPANK